MMYKISKGIDHRQLFMLIITFFIGACFLMVYWFSNNVNYLYIFILYCVILLIVNIFYSTLVDISISNKKIYIKNLYRKIEVDANQFAEVRLANQFHFMSYIPLFYVSPPYYIFKLKDGKKYFFVNTSATKAFDSIFSPANYIKEINETIKEELERGSQHFLL